MNKRTLSIIGLVVSGVVLFWTGTLYGQSRWAATASQPGWMMNDFNGNRAFMMNNGSINFLLVYQIKKYFVLLLKTDI